MVSESGRGVGGGWYINFTENLYLDQKLSSGEAEQICIHRVFPNSIIFAICRRLNIGSKERGYGVNAGLDGAGLDFQVKPPIFNSLNRRPGNSVNQGIII